MSKDRSLYYRSIPSVENGYAVLSITKPDQWFDSPDYVVFVGGCGVGHAKTLKIAKALLLEHAEAYCERQIRDSYQQLAHYERELQRLEKFGARITVSSQ